VGKRSVIYPLAFLFSAIILVTPSYLSNTSRNLRSIAKSVALNPQGTHQTFTSHLEVLPNKGYILVLYTGKQPDFSPTEYVTISMINQNLTIDLINGAGPQNVLQLTGKQASDYLNMHHIKLDTLDSLVAFSQ